MKRLPIILKTFHVKLQYTFLQATWVRPQPQKLLEYFAIFTLQVAWDTIKFDQKTVEKRIINTIFKEKVISEPQKSLHVPRAWALVADKLVACKKSVV